MNITNLRSFVVLVYCSIITWHTIDLQNKRLLALCSHCSSVDLMKMDQMKFSNLEFPSFEKISELRDFFNWATDELFWSIVDCATAKKIDKTKSLVFHRQLRIWVSDLSLSPSNLHFDHQNSSKQQWCLSMTRTRSRPLMQTMPTVSCRLFFRCRQCDTSSCTRIKTWRTSALHRPRNHFLTMAVFSCSARLLLLMIPLFGRSSRKVFGDCTHASTTTRRSLKRLTLPFWWTFLIWLTF